MNLARNITHHMKARGLRPVQLAKVMGKPRSTIHALTHGKPNPRLSTLVKVAAGLNMTVSELLAAPRRRCASKTSASVGETLESPTTTASTPS